MEELIGKSIESVFWNPQGKNVVFVDYYGKGYVYRALAQGCGCGGPCWFGRVGRLDRLIGVPIQGVSHIRTKCNHTHTPTSCIHRDKSMLVDDYEVRDEIQLHTKKGMYIIEYESANKDRCRGDVSFVGEWPVSSYRLSMNNDGTLTYISPWTDIPVYIKPAPDNDEEFD